MIRIVKPHEALDLEGTDFFTALYWRSYPICQKAWFNYKNKRSGELTSLRFIWNRPKKNAMPANEFVYDGLLSVLDAAQWIADSTIKSLYIQKINGENNLFALAETESHVAVEIEMNETLPDSVPDAAFLTSCCTDGHVTNKPLAGYFNVDGTLVATDDSCDLMVVEDCEIPEANGPFDWMEKRFVWQAEHGMIPPGHVCTVKLTRLIREAMKGRE